MSDASTRPSRGIVPAASRGPIERVARGLPFGGALRDRDRLAALQSLTAALARARTLDDVATVIIERALPGLEGPLRAFGADVSTASSARQALEAAGVVRPHVVVSDIGMPDGDGYARELRRSFRGPLIALTAFAGAEDRRRALDAGFSRHVAKPVDPDELARMIAELTASAAE